MSAELVRTDDKKIALAVLERYLDSADLVNARMQYLDGMFTVEVSHPTNCPGEPLAAD
jgi:hypothetical protein